MSLSDDIDDVKSLHIDPSATVTMDKRVNFSADTKLLPPAEGDMESIAFQAAPLQPSLARYVTELDLDQGVNLMIETQQFERWLIESALELTEGNQKRAATLLKAPQSTLNAKIKKYGLNIKKRKFRKR